MLNQAKPHVGHLKVGGFTSRYEQETDKRFNLDIAKTLTFYLCVNDLLIKSSPGFSFRSAIKGSI